MNKESQAQDSPFRDLDLNHVKVVADGPIEFWRRFTFSGPILVQKPSDKREVLVIGLDAFT